MALAVMIDGVNYITDLVHETLVVNQIANRLNSTCSFDLIIPDVVRENTWTVGHTHVETDGHVISGHEVFKEPKVVVSIEDGATKYFGGILSRVTVRPRCVAGLGGAVVAAAAQIITCRCNDFSQILEESIVDSFERYTTKTDEEIIDDIFGKYAAGINVIDHVTGGAYTFNVISFENMTVREVMDTIAIYTGYEWYVDYDKKLHYSVDGDAPLAWHLSDAPAAPNSYSFLDPIKHELDATNLVNRVFIVGSSESAWLQDAESMALYGTHQAIIKDTSLTVTANLATRGNAILDAFKDPIATYVVRTYKDGLRAGMEVQLVCAHLDVDDSFPLRKLAIKFPVDGEPIYELTLGGLDYSAGAPLPPSLLALGASGWSQTIPFTATDFNTVIWMAAGKITTAEGQVFNIVAGTTGDMIAGKTYFVYLDIDVSTTILQVTNDESVALGDHKLVIACCWPGTVLAGFQVFGISSPSGGEPIMAANATNIGTGVVTGTHVAALAIDTGHLVADCVTGAKIEDLAVNTEHLVAQAVIGSKIGLLAVDTAQLAAGAVEAAKTNIAQLSDITVDLGIVTAGEFRAYTGTWDNDADGFRLNATEFAGQENGVDQVIILAADGKLTAGAGAVTLDENGLYLVGTGALDNPRRILFQDDTAAGVPRTLGWVGSGWAGGANLGVTWLAATRDAGDPWPADIVVILAAVDTVAGTDVRLSVGSGQVIDFSGEKIVRTEKLFRPGTIANAAAEAALTLVEDGCLVYRLDTDKLRLRANGAWVDLN